jgi:two-component system sensor histidine kinase FlrB
LTDAFNIFNQLSQNLAESYQDLKAQVAQLTRELVAARSERLKTLIEKEKLAQRLQTILAALPAAVVVLNATEHIVECNPLALDFLGENLLGQHWSAVVNERLTSITHNPHEWQLNSGQRVSLTRRQLGDQGQILVLADVSEMRALQECLNQQKQLSAMGEMVASLAHQVRTPLSTAILYASQLHKPALSDFKRQEFSAKIMERLQHLDRQVNDMLIFAKEGRVTLSSVELAALLTGLNELMANYTRSGRIHWVMTNLADSECLPGNSDALQGALLNLLSNAVDALDGEGIISLTVWRVEQQLHILLKDNGHGIEAADLAHIFEPFFTTKMQGTGLGLAVVDSVIKAHGGRIACYSRKGRGAAFAITLPCPSPEPVALTSHFSTQRHQARKVNHATV